MKSRKKLIQIAIDSPAAAGAGTLAKSLSKHYKLLYLDTGKIYRMIALIKINKKKFKFIYLKKKNNNKKKNIIIYESRKKINGSVVSHLGETYLKEHAKGLIQKNLLKKNEK